MGCQDCEKQEKRQWPTQIAHDAANATPYCMAASFMVLLIVGGAFAADFGICERHVVEHRFGIRCFGVMNVFRCVLRPHKIIAP